MSGELLGAVTALGGVILGYMGQLLLARRQESRRLDDARRELYASFLTETQRALNTLAEGALNRINGAVERGAYAARFLEDHARIQATISGMELISTSRVLVCAREFLQAQWDFANDEANAEPVDRDLEDENAKAMMTAVMTRLEQLSRVNEAFVAAAQKELKIASLVERQQSA